MQDVLRIVMDSLGVRNYYFAEDGKEAIEILQLRSGTLKAVGSGGIDVVISDVVMPGIDGNMLLRWIRRSENSPDRFVPVVMISGMVDRKCLTTARDAGVNEFVAKPFSPDIIFKRVQKVIESPRQFVYTPTYFGPDRRRSRGFVEEDRRKLSESDCEIVYSGKDPGKFRKDKPPVWLFRMPNRLKEKLSGGDFEFASDGGLADTDILEAAKAQIAEMADDYTDWVKETITDLVNAHEEAQNSFGKAEEQMKIAMEKLNLLAHELRGQGGVFGYPLISEFGKSLYNCSGASARVTENLLEFVKTHIDGITAVINGNVKGDGGPVGKELLKSLEAAKKKYSGDSAKAA
jgi:CheY-like chemotaxis protein